MRTVKIIKPFTTSDGRAYREGTSGTISDPNLKELEDAGAVKITEQITMNELEQLEQSGKYNIEFKEHGKRTKQEKKFNAKSL